MKYHIINNPHQTNKDEIQNGHQYYYSKIRPELRFGQFNPHFMDFNVNYGD